MLPVRAVMERSAESNAGGGGRRRKNQRCVPERWLELKLPEGLLEKVSQFFFF